jgi:hypothetical protein
MGHVAQKYVTEARNMVFPRMVTDSTWQRVSGICWETTRGDLLRPPQEILKWLRGLDLNQRPSGYENVLK